MLVKICEYLKTKLKVMIKLSMVHFQLENCINVVCDYIGKLHKFLNITYCIVMAFLFSN